MHSCHLPLIHLPTDCTLLSALSREQKENEQKGKSQYANKSPVSWVFTQKRQRALSVQHQIIGRFFLQGTLERLFFWRAPCFTRIQQQIQLCRALSSWTGAHVGSKCCREATSNIWKGGEVGFNHQFTDGWNPNLQLNEKLFRKVLTTANFQLCIFQYRLL